LGIGEYIFTFTRPVVVDGKVLGVVGADVALEALQRALLNRDAGDDPVALVNHKGRVIFSTDVELESGSLLRTPQFAARNSEIHSRANLVSSVWPCGTNWAVVALNRPLGGPA
jgi:C4-dicarboxylate-specific signal transduction histidine kinase